MLTVLYRSLLQAAKYTFSTKIMEDYERILDLS